MKKISLLAASALLASLFTVSAQSDFDKAVNIILTKNYELLISEEENEIEVINLKSENNLPETEVSFSHRWGNLNSTKLGVEVSQGFDWPGLYHSRGKEVDLTKSAIKQLQVSRILDKQTQARIMIIDYIAARKKVALAEEVAENMKQLSSFYDRAYEHGEVNILDRNKVRVEYVRAKSALTTANNERENALAAIIAECEDNRIIPILNSIESFPEQPVFTEEKYEEVIKSADPMLEYYRNMERVAAQKRKTAKLGYFPSFSLGYGFEREEGQNFHGFNIGLGLPIFSNRNKTKAAEVLQTQFSNNLLNEQLRQISKMRATLSDIKLLDSTISDFSEIFKDKSQIQLLKKAFEGGEINLFTYLSDLSFFTEAEFDYLDARATRARLVTELNKLMH